MTETVKYFIETEDEDFVISIPKDDEIQVIFGSDNFGGESPRVLKVVQRTTLQNFNDQGHVDEHQFNDHVLARYEGVKACRCEHILRVEPEVA